MRALLRYLISRFLSRKVTFTKPLGGYEHVQLETHPGEVAIVIPTRDKVELLATCVESILTNTNYENYHIIIVDNNSVALETKKYLNALDEVRFTVLPYQKQFNYSEICNFAVQHSNAEFFCFLNNDTVVKDPNWLTKMVSHAKTPNVGVVGARLIYPDGRLQHLGVALGINGLATHVNFRNLGINSSIDSMKSNCFEVSAVTFACVVVSKTNFISIGGMDVNFPVGLNDVDFCLRAKSHGFSVVLCGETQLIHVESATRPQALSLKGFRQGVRDLSLFLRKHGWPKPDEFFKLSKHKAN